MPLKITFIPSRIDPQEQVTVLSHQEDRVAAVSFVLDNIESRFAELANALDNQPCGWNMSSQMERAMDLIQMAATLRHSIEFEHRKWREGLRNKSR